MIRRLGLVLAVAAGLCAALLVGTGVDVQHDGESVSCGSVINAAAVTDVRANREVDLACHDAQVSAWRPERSGRTPDADLRPAT